MGIIGFISWILGDYDDDYYWWVPKEHIVDIFPKEHIVDMKKSLLELPDIDDLLVHGDEDDLITNKERIKSSDFFILFCPMSEAFFSLKKDQEWEYARSLGKPMIIIYHEQYREGIPEELTSEVAVGCYAHYKLNEDQLLELYGLIRKKCQLTDLNLGKKMYHLFKANKLDLTKSQLNAPNLEQKMRIFCKANDLDLEKLTELQKKMIGFLCENLKIQQCLEQFKTQISDKVRNRSLSGEKNLTIEGLVSIEGISLHGMGIFLENHPFVRTKYARYPQKKISSEKSFKTLKEKVNKFHSEPVKNSYYHILNDYYCKELVDLALKIIGSNDGEILIPIFGRYYWLGYWLGGSYTFDIHTSNVTLFLRVNDGFVITLSGIYFNRNIEAEYGIHVIDLDIEAEEELEGYWKKNFLTLLKNIEKEKDMSYKIGNFYTLINSTRDFDFMIKHASSLEPIVDQIITSDRFGDFIALINSIKEAPLMTMFMPKIEPVCLEKLIEAMERVSKIKNSLKIELFTDFFDQIRDTDLRISLDSSIKTLYSEILKGIQNIPDPSEKAQLFIGLFEWSKKTDLVTILDSQFNNLFENVLNAAKNILNPSKKAQIFRALFNSVNANDATFESTLNAIDSIPDIKQRIDCFRRLTFDIKDTDFITRYAVPLENLLVDLVKKFETIEDIDGYTYYGDYDRIHYPKATCYHALLGIIDSNPTWAKYASQLKKSLVITSFAFLHEEDFQDICDVRKEILSKICQKNPYIKWTDFKIFELCKDLGYGGWCLFLIANQKPTIAQLKNVVVKGEEEEDDCKYLWLFKNMEDKYASHIREILQE